jgi:hypothetical protein
MCLKLFGLRLAVAPNLVSNALGAVQREQANHRDASDGEGRGIVSPKGPRDALAIEP